MLANSYTLDYTGTDDLVLKRTNQDAGGSTFFFRGSNYDVTMTVKHTYPAVRGSGEESHLVRFDVQQYDTDGILIKTSSVWTVIVTRGGAQDNTVSSDIFGSLMEFMGLSGMLDAILGREA